MLTNIGTEYGVENVFDLSKMQPYNLDKLYKEFSKLTKHIVLYLPRTYDLNQIARYAPEGKKVEVAHYAILGASKVSGMSFQDVRVKLTRDRRCALTMATSISKGQQRKRVMEEQRKKEEEKRRAEEVERKKREDEQRASEERERE